jgi:Zn-dependent protease with chaperone function
MAAAVACILALLPGGLARWWGRRIVSSPPDEALPERLLAHRRRVGMAAAVCVCLLVLLAGVHAAWAIPLLALALLHGSHPLRRAVRQETWAFGAYASHMLRFATASAGFFVLLAAAPALVVSLGPAAAAPLLVILALWALATGPVFLFLVRATRLDRPGLAADLARVVAKSRAAEPRLYRAGPRGGRMVNAFALPGLPRASVLFTDDLLDLFSPDETAAVFAHELAHLEHFDRRRLLLRVAALLALAGLAAFAVPLLASHAPAHAGWITAGWALAVLVALPAGLVAHRGHEAESDRRAVELCGDPEALVRALVKLHTLAILPRRWSVDVERGSTHPSLARRVQAIRRSSGSPPPALSEPVVLAGNEPGRFVVLENERAHWIEGGPAELASRPEDLRLAATAVRSFPYGELADLHLEAGGSGVGLHARTVSGRKWRVPLRSDAVSAAQAALDVVDERLAPTPASSSGGMGALTAALVVLAGILAGHPLIVLPPAAVGLFRPGPAPLAAAGGTALVAALLAAWHADVGSGVRALVSFVLGLAGFVALVAALARWRREPAARGQGARVALAVQLAVSAIALVGLAVASTSGSLFRFHRAAATPGPAAVLFGLGAALLLRPSGSRRVAILPFAASLLVALAGSDAFARRFVSDPFLAPAPALRETAVTLVPLAEHRFRGRAGELRLSPSGRTFAVRGWEDEEESPAPFRIGGEGVEPRDIAASALRFVDDGRLLVVEDTDGRARVSLLRPAAAEPEWSRDLGRILGAQLEVDSGQGIWRVTGADFGAGEARVFSGTLDGGPPSETRLPLPKGPPGQLFLEERGGVSSRPALPRLGAGGSWPTLLPLGAVGSGPLFDSEVALLTASGPRPLGLSAMEIQCVPPAIDGPIYCLAYDGARTTVWEIDPSSGRREPRGTLPDRIGAWQAADTRLLATSPSLGPVLLRPRESSWSRLGPERGYASALGAATVGVLRNEGDGGTVAIFAAR